MQTPGQTEIDLLDSLGESDSELARNLRTAGFDVREFASQAEIDDADKKDARPILVYSLQSISGNVLSFVRRAKQDNPGRLFICSTSRHREPKRLRLLEAGADEVVPLEQTEAGIRDILSGFVQVAEARPEEAAEEGSSTEEDTAAAPSGQMFFQLAKGELSNALQFLCMSPRTGCLDIEFADSGEKAEIYLADQTVSHAEGGGKKGIEAMAFIINREGQRKAVFYEGREAPEQTNQQPLSQFLLEASVMADELRAAE